MKTWKKTCSSIRNNTQKYGKKRKRGSKYFVLHCMIKMNKENGMSIVDAQGT